MHCLNCGPIHFDDTTHGTLDPDQEIVYGLGVEALAAWVTRITTQLDNIATSQRTDPGKRLYLLLATEAPYLLGPLLHHYSHLLDITNPADPQISDIANQVRRDVNQTTSLFAAAPAPEVTPEACPILAVTA